MNAADRQARCGPLPWREACDLVLVDLWARMCEHRRSTGQPLPPEHLRPRLADPQPEQSEGDTPS